VANLTGLSYYEINFIIFIVLFPLALLFSVLFFFIQKRRLRELKEKKLNENKTETISLISENKFALENYSWNLKRLIMHFMHPVHAIALAIPFSFLILISGPYYKIITIFICTFLAISILYTLMQRKWLLALTGIFLYVGYMFCLSFLIIIVGTIMGHSSVVDEAFYSSEINSTTNLTIPKDLHLISKKDTIYYVGIENEYDAECLYEGPKETIMALENNLKMQTGISSNDQLPDLSETEINLSKFKKKDIGTSYSTSKEGSYDIDIAFNKEKTRMYYSARYY
jgi:hypothetical protein